MQKYLIITLLIFLGSCRDRSPVAEGQKTNDLSGENLLQIIKPKYGEKIHEGDELVLEVKFQNEVDSVIALFDNRLKLGKFQKNQTRFSWIVASERLGTKTIEFIIYKGAQTFKRQLKIILLDKNEPKLLSYRVVKVHPHATDAYTQGLIFFDNILYESDGQYGKSTLRKVEIETGKTLQQHILSDKYFAEGIAMIGDYIYQITWRENTCFVYDKKNLTLVAQKTYDIAEGWGLASDGQHLYMSDGSNRIYIIEPETFSVIDFFEVLDNQGAVDNLNELEYVDGYLYANVYQTDYIVVIDINRKRLVGKINMANLLQPSDIKPNTDVLNGIAYNPHTGRFYVTGKNWPKLFEVELSSLKLK